MSRSAELDEDRVYQAHVAERAAVAADRALLAELVTFIHARATRCMRTGCQCLALWRRAERGPSGSPREELRCDEHRIPGSVAIEGADVLRRVAERALR